MYSVHEVYDYNNSGYGHIVYYSSEECGFVNGLSIITDCKYDYESSDIKYIIDAWAKDNLDEKDLWQDNLGYGYRLISKDEVLEYFHYSSSFDFDYSYVSIKDKTPSWVYDDKYTYYTMSSINRINPYGAKIFGVNLISSDGEIVVASTLYATPSAIRPVVLLRKKALESKSNTNIDNNGSNNQEEKTKSKNNNNTNTNISKNQKEKQNSSIIKNDSSSDSNVKARSINVSVPDTFTKVSILSITIGIILIGTATTIIFYIRNRSKNEKVS